MQQRHLYTSWWPRINESEFEFESLPKKAFSLEFTIMNHSLKKQNYYDNYPFFMICVVNTTLIAFRSFRTIRCVCASCAKNRCLDFEIRSICQSIMPTGRRCHRCFEGGLVLIYIISTGRTRGYFTWYIKAI